MIVAGWICLVGASLAALLAPAPPPNLEDFNVVWTSPGGDASGSMPIGNGTVGANVWVDQEGDIVLLISRTDSWSETDRLLKLGRVRIRLAPNPFVGPDAGKGMVQTLRLREGRIDLTAGGGGGPGATVTVYAAEGLEQLRVEGASERPVRVIAAAETWRTAPVVLADDDELTSSWTMRAAPKEIREAYARESADVMAVDRAPRRDAIEWYHRNEHSVVAMTLEHQGLGPIREHFTDPLLHRTFGARLEGDADGTPMPAEGINTIDSRRPVKSFEVRITTRCEQTPTAAAWLAGLRQSAEETPPTAQVRAAHERWWSAFWDRSWVFVSGDPAPAPAATPPRWPDPTPRSVVTRGYILQRWMQACAGGPRDGTGRFPIKFNGSIFTVEPAPTQGQPHNADWRKWGGSFWWQNTRLPYHAMLAAGDFDLMDSLFRFYEDALPASRARTTLYYGAQGVYFPETITSFATYANGDYGWNRKGLAPGDISPCPWWQWAWNPSLELTHLMLDYAAYTGDAVFLRDRALPMARETLLYFDTRFKRDAAGKLVISPTQAVETYWHEVVNDAPTVGGLHAVCDALLALPENIGTPENRALWRRVKDATPALPVWRPNADGPRMAAPAERFKNQRNNVETAELYPLWPFRCYGWDRPGWDLALQAFRHRADKSTVGWTQDGLFAASLGLTTEARHQLVARAANSNPKHRFPVMWGPNFDWLPDQCHGSNLMTQVHLMLITPTHDGRIKLLPAWPKEWDVSFKLHAPRQTTVELVWRGGEVRSLRVSPESRREDVIEPQYPDD